MTMLPFSRPLMSAFFSSLTDIASQTSLSLPEVCRKAHQLGYRAVDICDKVVTPQNMAILQDNGLDISLIFSLLDFGKGEEASQQCSRLLTLAERYHAAAVMPLPFHDKEYDVVTKRRMFFELCRMADIMISLGKCAVLEIFDYPEESYSNTQGLLVFLQEVPSLKLCFDTGNYLFSGEDYRQAYFQMKSRVAHVHLKDRATTNSFGRFICTPRHGPPLASAPLGDGFLDLRNFVHQLLQDSYSGYLTIEHPACEDELTAMTRSAEHLTEWLEAPDVFLHNAHCKDAMPTIPDYQHPFPGKDHK